MIEATGGPVGAEVVLHKFDTIVVDRVDQVFRLFLAVSDQAQTAELFRARGVEKDMERIRQGAKKIRSAPSDDDAFSSCSGAGHHILPDGNEAIRVEGFGAFQGHAAFIAASPECLGQAVKGAVEAFVAIHHGRPVRKQGDGLASLAGDFIREGLIPERPAQAIGNFAGDFGGSASEFAFDGDNSKHGAPF